MAMFDKLMTNKLFLK